MAIEQLTRGIIDLSIANDWDNARLEWRVALIYDSEEPGTCLCGHFPIIEFCELHNSKNENNVIVGNCCVKKFMGLNSEALFSSLRKVKKDVSASFNADVIFLARENNFINDWEKKFYISIWRKRNLSEKQLQTKVKINQKLLYKFEKKR